MIKKFSLIMILFFISTGHVYANNCSNPRRITCGECVTGSTVGEVHDFIYPGSCPGAFNGPDVVFVLTVSAPAIVTVRAESDETWNADYAIFKDNGWGCEMAFMIYCVNFNGIWNPDLPCGGLKSHTFPDTDKDTYCTGYIRS